MYLSDVLQIIGPYSFANSELEEIEIPRNVREIQDFAFAGCRALRSIRFADGCQLQKIGVGAFANTQLEVF